MGRSLVFALNGQRVELEAVDPRTTVLQYIRSQTSLQGTKLSCGEGGCGACTVLLSKYDPTSGNVDEISINSCLALLCSIDGCAITTTEGLKPSKNEFHAVHQRLAGFHGSQCGFCTPGMSMSIYGGLRKAAANKSGGDKTASANGHDHGQCNGSTGCGGPQQPGGGLELSVAEARKCIMGNICRCTGYRPILDTCSSFSGDVDVEDLGVNSFWESKQQARADLLPSYDPSKDPKFPEFLVEELKARAKEAEAVAAAAGAPAKQLSFKHVEGTKTIAERVWITATSLREVFNLLKEHSAKEVEVKLVVGNTSAGVYKDMKPQVFIDISKLPELQKVQSTEDGLEVGAGVSLSKLIGALDAEPDSNKTVVYTELSKHIGQIASVQVRNRGSLGGNLILAQQRRFDSDLATILLGAGTTVTVASSEGETITISLEEFLSQPDAGAILLSIRIPGWKKLHQAVGGDKAAGRQELLFKTYRVSCRPNGNAVSYINAAFLAVVDRSGSGTAAVVDHLRLAFGAFGGPHALRAEKTERALIGKSITPAVLLEAIHVLKEEIKPPPSLHKAAYRGSVAVGFLFEFFRSFLDSETTAASIISNGEVAEEGHEVADGNHAQGDPLTAASNGTDHKAEQNGGVHHPDASTANVRESSLLSGLSDGPAAAGGNFGNAALASHIPEAAADGGKEKENAVAELGIKDKIAPVSSAPTVAAEEDKEEESVVAEFGSKDKLAKAVGKSRSSAPPTFLSSQKFATSKQFWPVAQPTKKIGVELQAAGESVYVDDVPPVKGTLFAQFVFSDKQAGKLLKIDAAEALSSPGVVDFISAKDITGENVGHYIMMFQAPLFVEDRVETVNDLVGLVVAESYEHARDGAAKVKVYVEEDEGSIYTIEEAVAKESYGDHGFIFASSKHASYGEPPVAKSDHRIENAELRSSSQYYFYMEPQVAYAVPDEDGCMTVYSANQAPNGIQQGIAKCLGIPMNNVRVITRRIGGAFGGKMRRASNVAVACALTAQKLGRPVRMFLDRQTDMRLCAGRHEAKGVYTVDFNNDGKVNSLQAKVFLDAGRAEDLTPLICQGVMSSLRQYNWGHLDSESVICKTNKTPRAVMRGPGEVQGHFISESIIEHVAGYLGLDPFAVRERNMHSVETLDTFFPGSGPHTEVSYTLPHLWHKLKETSKFEARKRAIEKFNAESKWVKRGIDMVVGLYVTSTLTKQARVSIFEDASVVVEVGGIDMGQGLWTKVRQAVAYGLQKLWEPGAHPLEKVDMSRIRIIQNDSLSLPNSEPTGASTGSEACCQAALYACAELVEGFKPIVKNLREVNGGGGAPVPFEAIVGLAKFGGSKLTATGIHAPDMMAGYVNFGVGVSEVSIDLLTGGTTVLQTDMHYDCGKSLNPALDVGQVEGSFMMGLGFYLTEEWQEDKGRVISDSTWDYKPPTADNIPQKLHIELSNTKANKNRILSSKASGEPPILLAKSVHSAIRQAIIAAREDHGRPSGKTEEQNSSYFVMGNLASIDKVKGHCGFDIVEKYLEGLH